MRKRHLHLDFHTSPFIPEVGVEFDKKVFAKTIKEAHIDSVNLFSKCHHGMAYYPSKIVPRHPHLKPGLDLMGDMIHALQEQNIKACIYTTVAWEEVVANAHPEWRQIHEDGSFAVMNPSADGVTIQPGMWKFTDFANPDFQDYYEAHLIELLENYNADGYWIDIVFYYPGATWSEPCKKIRKKLGLEGNTQREHLLVEYYAQVEFCKRMTKVIHSRQPEASIFYNTPNNRYVDANTGVLGSTKYQTHIEIESLPTGFWGYHHYPRNARHLGNKGMEWLAMTGKFQKMWGDFGGIKPQAALEYECFRAQALGGAVCVGDQLHPNGILDPSTYDLIGAVYQQIAVAEDIYKGAERVKEVAIVTPNHVSKEDHQTGMSEEGAIILLESLHYQIDILDDASSFDGYKLIILPDDVVITPSLIDKLEAYKKSGGKLLITNNSLFDESGKEVLDFLPLKYEGVCEMKPTYWSAKEYFSGTEFKGERVVYNQGLNITSEELEIIIDRVFPYFPRTDLKYCSHFQAPPIPNSKDDYAAALGNDELVYFAEPIFREYRDSGNYFVKKCFEYTVEKLIGKPMYGFGLNPDILSVALKKDKDLIVSLLNYIPVKKAINQDIIEYPGSLYGEEITFLNYTKNKIESVLDNKKLEQTNGSFKIHNVKGRVILQVKDFFS